MQAASILGAEIDQDNPMPSRNHSRVAHNLSVALDPFSDRFAIHQQLSLNLNGWRAVPDVALYPKDALPDDWMFDEDEVTIPPCLAIEILSPKQNIGPLLEKIRDFLTHGVKSCWLIEPATRVISVYPASGGSRAFVDGDIRDEALGISFPVSKLFH